jgi:DNA invertase Pin-like site-specific DNA recombinase
MSAFARTQSPAAPKRCAIYTRKSLEQGLDSEFNSLDAQRAICSAFLTSQAHRRWTELPAHYDDAGHSGATLDRPALQRLLADVENGLVDVILIYKLDRLTRSLRDFVRLLDLFEQYDVVFVSITQNFDTDDSMGRLILNVLLTFAQFEREMLADRLRDKFGAMRQRGMFVGGHPAFGYDLVDRRLRINRREAAAVRRIYNRFLELKSYHAVLQDCSEAGLVTKVRTTRDGRQVGGNPLNIGIIYHVLKNPLYVGKVKHLDQLYDGVHSPIVSKEIWDKVQALRSTRKLQTVVHIPKGDLLRGMMFDSFGRLMCCRHDNWRGRKCHRYYFSNQNEWGRRHHIRRFRANADELEALVLASIRALLCDRERVRSILLGIGYFGRDLDGLAAAGGGAAARLQQSERRRVRAILLALICRIELSRERVKLVLRKQEIADFLGWGRSGMFKGSPDSWGRPHATELVDIPACAVRYMRRFTLPIEPRRAGQQAHPSARLIRLVREARQLQSVVDSERDSSIAELARVRKLAPVTFERKLRLNYLAPDIITAILDGTQPAGLTGRRLMTVDLPLDWALQRKLLGFADRPDHRPGDDVFRNHRAPVLAG